MKQTQFDPLQSFQSESKTNENHQINQIFQTSFSNQETKQTQQIKSKPNENKTTDHPSEILKILHRRMKALFDLKVNDNIIFGKIDEEDINYDFQSKVFNWNIFDSSTYEYVKRPNQITTVIFSKDFPTNTPKYQLLYFSPSVYKIIPFKFYYFEITVESNKPLVSIGLVNDIEYDKSRHIGQYKDSVGLFSKGSLLLDSTNCQKCTKQFKNGDVIGCGYNPENGCFFFTKNGEFLGMYGGEDYTSFALGLEVYEKITINSGKQPFAFDISKFYKEWENKGNKQFFDTYYVHNKEHKEYSNETIELSMTICKYMTPRRIEKLIKDWIEKKIKDKNERLNMVCEHGIIEELYFFGRFVGEENEMDSLSERIFIINPPSSLQLLSKNKTIHFEFISAENYQKYQSNHSSKRKLEPRK